VSSPPNHTVQVGLFDIEVNVESVHRIQIGASAQDVVHHLDVSVTSLWILCGIAADLNTGGVERCVLVLVRGDEDDVLEPLRPLLLTEAVESRLFGVFRISHAQLVEDYTLLPTL